MGAKVSPERGLLTKVWRDRRQNQASLGRNRPGAGRSACSERPVRPERLGDEGAPADDRRERLELRVGEDRAGRGKPLQRSQSGSAGILPGSLRLIVRGGLLNGLPFWPVVEEPVTEHPGAFHGQGEKARVVVRRYLKGIALP